MSKLHKDSMGDDDIFIQELLKAENDGSRVEKKKSNKQVMNKSDWENRFNMLLKLDLIDVPRDFYEEELLFDEPERLMDVFTQLEEQNLQNISKTQEYDEALEKIVQQEEATHLKIGGELEQQIAVKRELESQIHEAKINLLEL